MADVFISYHEKSAGELAQQIASTLESAEVSCWVARRDMSSGQNFALEIPAQIDACRVFLLLLNEEASQSKHVANELALAFERFKGDEIQILPVKMGEFPLSATMRYYLPLIQVCSYSWPPDAQQLHKITERVAQLLKREPPPAPPKPNIIDRGKCGDNVSYTLYDNGLLTVYGDGPMWNALDSSPDKMKPYGNWLLWRDRVSRIEIQDGVTSIGKWSFFACKNVTRIHIPDSVTYIGVFAFLCDNLGGVLVPRDAVIAKTAFIKTGRIMDYEEFTHVMRRP